MNWGTTNRIDDGNGKPPDRIGRIDSIEQTLRVDLGSLPQRVGNEGTRRLGHHPPPRNVFLHSLGAGDALPDAEAVIFSILPILAILSCRCRLLRSG